MSRRFVKAWVFVFVGLSVALAGVGAVCLPVFATALAVFAVVLAVAFLGIGAGFLAFTPRGGANNSLSAGDHSSWSGHSRASIISTSFSLMPSLVATSQALACAARAASVATPHANGSHRATWEWRGQHDGRSS